MHRSTPVALTFALGATVALLGCTNPPAKDGPATPAGADPVPAAGSS